MELNISNMNLKDLNEISNYLVENFDDFWSYEVFKSELLCDNSTFYVARLNNKIVGFAGFKTIFDEAELMNIVVHKSARTKGIGTALLKHIILELKKQKIATLHLEVAKDNLPAIHLYEFLGFKKVGIRKGYYNGIDAILLDLSL